VIDLWRTHDRTCGNCFALNECDDVSAVSNARGDGPNQCVKHKFMREHEDDLKVARFKQCPTIKKPTTLQKHLFDRGLDGLED